MLTATTIDTAVAIANVTNRSVRNMRDPFFSVADEQRPEKSQSHARS